MKTRPSLRTRRRETRRTLRVRVDPKASLTVELAWLLLLTTEAMDLATRDAAPSDATLATEASPGTTRPVAAATLTATATVAMLINRTPRVLLKPLLMLLKTPMPRRSAVFRRRFAPSRTSRCVLLVERN
jgi:hypothetical protein